MRKVAHPEVRSAAFAACASFLCACTGSPPAPEIPAHAVIAVSQEQLDAQYWIDKQASASSVVLDTAAIERHNRRLRELDPSIHDVENLPATLTAAQVRKWIETLAEPPGRALYDEQGNEVGEPAFAQLRAGLDLDHVPVRQETRFGLVVRRGDLRKFPSHLRVFHTRGDRDIDRFQESALFPGTPVALVHESADREWWFVVSPNYAAWIRKEYVAAGSKQAVFDYTRRTPFLVVTGARATTVFTRERPEVSQLQLDMGVRVPVLKDWPADKAVNGQHPYAAYVIELPMRAHDDSLAFTPALLPRTDDVRSDYLPLNRANLLRQGFKFLGERYGWGHAYNGRDCSGFVSEVYRSFGVHLPRNTGDQAFSPAYDYVDLRSADAAQRATALANLAVGDLVYIPGHVMLVIGRDKGISYVIHDTTGISYRDAQGEPRHVKLNSVAVTPLDPLLIGRKPIAESITSIVRIRPPAARQR